MHKPNATSGHRALCCHVTPGALSVHAPVRAQPEALSQNGFGKARGFHTHTHTDQGRKREYIETLREELNELESILIIKLQTLRMEACMHRGVLIELETLRELADALVALRARRCAART